jgi:hypothetical protein
MAEKIFFIFLMGMMNTLRHYVQDTHKTREVGEMIVGPLNLGNIND